MKEEEPPPPHAPLSTKAQYSHPAPPGSVPPHVPVKEGGQQEGTRASPEGNGTKHPHPTKHRKKTPIGHAVSYSSLGTLCTNLTDGSRAISCGEGSKQPPQKDLQDSIYRMRPEE